MLTIDTAYIAVIASHSSYDTGILQYSDHETSECWETFEFDTRTLTLACGSGSSQSPAPQAVKCHFAKRLEVWKYLTNFDNP